jgi:hypothetical protein
LQNLAGVVFFYSMVAVTAGTMWWLHSWQKPFVAGDEKKDFSKHTSLSRPFS